MCGISGKLNFGADRVERSLIARMNSAIVHRGPDDEGIHIDGRIGLGERRLAIIDLNHNATAPLTNEDRTLWLVFNGEIYNYRELRDRLRARGHRFTTESDTEVILHLYEDHGVGCLDHLRGMFAFALWDAPRARVFAARDRMGKKPFIYCRSDRALTFGSEITALLADPGVPVNPDFEAIDSYLDVAVRAQSADGVRGCAQTPAGPFPSVLGERRAVGRALLEPVGEAQRSSARCFDRRG